MTIDDVLGLARIETNTMQMPLASVDVGSVVNGVLSKLQRFADEKGSRRTAGIPAEMTVLSSERALTRLLIKLVSSAISFTEAGGVQILGILRDGVGTARVDVIDIGVGSPGAGA
jgi:signal transduction histidine kinase